MDFKANIIFRGYAAQSADEFKNYLDRLLTKHGHYSTEIRVHEINVEQDSPNLVTDKIGNIIGIVTKWNPMGFGEAIVQYFDGSADSAFMNELTFPNGIEAARKYLNDQER